MRNRRRDPFGVIQDISLVLIPHSSEKVIRIRISRMVILASLYIVPLIIILSVAAMAMTDRIAPERDRELRLAQAWENKLRMIDDLSSEIDDFTGLFTEEGRDLYRSIWNEPFPYRQSADRDMAAAFQRNTAPLASALRFIATREEAFQAMPIGIPMASAQITSPYGSRVSPFGLALEFHTGMDFANAVGTPLRATADGTVIYATGDASGYGLHVKILHKYGLMTLYAHCSGLNVTQDQIVRRGDVVGFLGQTGSATGPHLHYEVRVKNNDPLNPLEYTMNPWPFVKESL